MEKLGHTGDKKDLIGIKPLLHTVNITNIKFLILVELSRENFRYSFF